VIYLGDFSFVRIFLKNYRVTMTTTLDTSFSENTMVLSAREGFACMYFLVYDLIVTVCEISYLREQVNLSIVTWFEISVFISGEAGHLSFPNPRGLRYTSTNWTEEIYLLYLVNIYYLCIIINNMLDRFEIWLGKYTLSVGNQLLQFTKFVNKEAFYI
jgi:hypothetical protein